MVIFHSYVKLPEGNWATLRGLFRDNEATAVGWVLSAADGLCEINLWAACATSDLSDRFTASGSMRPHGKQQLVYTNIFFDERRKAYFPRFLGTIANLPSNACKSE